MHNSRWAFLALCLLATVVATTAAQSVYPPRWSNQPEVRSFATASIASMDGLRLVPQTSPPVDFCNADTVGMMYYQTDVHDKATTPDSPEDALCICFKCASGCAGTPFAASGYVWHGSVGLSCAFVLTPPPAP